MIKLIWRFCIIPSDKPVWNVMSVSNNWKSNMDDAISMLSNVFLAPWPPVQVLLQKIRYYEKRQLYNVKYFNFLSVSDKLEKNQVCAKRKEKKKSATIWIMHIKWQIWALENGKNAKNVNNIKKTLQVGGTTSCHRARVSSRPPSRAPGRAATHVMPIFWSMWLPFLGE